MTDDPRESVEVFARLIATLDDPFADRAAVLGDASLDAADLSPLIMRWQEVILRDPSALAERFTRAYREAADALRAVRTGEPSTPKDEPPAQPPGGRDPRGLDVTLGGAAHPVGRPALPFVAPGRTPVAPPRTALAPPRTDAGGTVQLHGERTDAPLPFEVEGVLAALSVEQYAAFRAALGVNPEARAAIQARYGVQGDPAQRRLDESWRKRFAADGLLQKRFLAIAASLRNLAEDKKAGR